MCAGDKGMCVCAGDKGMKRCECVCVRRESQVCVDMDKHENMSVCVWTKE